MQNSSLPSLLDIKVNVPQRYLKNISTAFKEKGLKNNTQLEQACQSFINQVRWGQPSEASSVEVFEVKKQDRGFVGSQNDLRGKLQKKRKFEYRDWDEVQEEEYSAFLRKREADGKQSEWEWNKLLAMVKRQITPINESSAKNENIESIDTKISGIEPKNQYHHIMVKHKHCSRPSSWREKCITRTKQEAIKCIKEYKGQIENGSISFEALAAKISDCSSIQSNDFKLFGPEKIVQLFENTVSKLQIDTISEPIVTNEGIHILKRLF